MILRKTKQQNSIFAGVVDIHDFYNSINEVPFNSYGKIKEV